MFYSLRSFANGGHDLVHDIPADQRSGSKTLSAVFKDTGSRWVYLATRKSGVIHRTYFDLLNGRAGQRSPEHGARIAHLGGGWHRVAVDFQGSNVTSVHFGIAGGNGAPYFSANPGTDRVFFTEPELSGGSVSLASAAASEKGLWVWRADPVLDQGERTALVNFMSGKGLNAAYVDARIPVLNNHYMLSEFIRTLSRQGIAVELMFGKPEWALFEHHHEVLNLVDQSIEYLRRHPEEAPVAVHLDIEAHLVGQWQDNRNSVANQLLDLLAKVRSRLAGTGLPLVVDIPVWWDTFSVTRNGVSRPLHQWVIDGSDRTVLMDYRDTESRIVNDASQELQYAASKGKQVVVGVETMCIPPELITFCEEGARVMESVLANVDRRLKADQAAYRGTAVHHYHAYRNLRP
ncbi:hypothetical protein NCG89_09890 [Spongiibacter taiwanensis]|uniref:hypothetical protein n=1 Tax=Spongiibacter taiwanensis TaxID=1748242 RepID=UPI0020350514|nr:hypothetical protein [Spongiibacter taiwanensis]USA41828.1 hypothetical protein NCG89_09890 [Spongiibacter taiwanensis]